MRLIRKLKRHLPSKDAVRKILLGLTAFSLFTAPPHVHASEITDKDGASLINPDENIHNLYAQELDGNLARSVYNDFNLSQNEIANMHFTKGDGSGYAFNLVNFVNERVDINGTVNALRDGAIDGNLYFLSPEGIAVGASGVINAGSFNAYAVDSGDFEDLRDGSMSDLRTQLATNINGGYLTPSEKSVEINGVINARNQIAIRGQSVTVGSGATLNADSKIDFTHLVNAGGTVENIENLNMTAAPEGNGDIVISVSAEHVANDSIFDSFSGTALTVWPGNKTTTLEPAITVNGILTASGNVNLNANSNTQFSEGSVFNLIGSVKGSFLNQLGIDIDADWIDKTNNATITVGGNINAGGNVTLDANAVTNARIISETAAQRQAYGISNLIPTLAFIYAESDNNAVIDVTGNINAAGNVTAKATADTTLDLTATSQTTASDSGISSVLYTAVGVANADNKAQIDLNAVNAGGTFSANATGNYHIDNKVRTVTPDASFLSTAIGINEGDSKAIVNINGDINANAIDIDALDKDVFSRSTVANEIGGRGVNNPFEVSGSGVTGSLFSALGSFAGSNSFIGDHSFNIMSGDSTISKLLTGGLFKAGISVGVLSNNHDADINVKDGVKLTAAGDLTLDANLNTAALHSDVTNVLNNKASGSNSGTKVGIGAAINVADVDNNANVVVGRNVELTGNNVAVNSNAKADYDQFDAEIDYIKTAWTDFVATCKQFGADFSSGDDEVEDAINDLENTSDKFEYAQKMADIQDKINERYNDYSFKQFTNTFTDGANIYTQLKIALKRTLGVIDPANYVNFYARASVQDNQTQDSASAADITGAVQILGVDDNALTLLAEGVKVNSNSAANLTSNAGTDIVELTGQGGKYLAASDFGAGAGVGASVVVTGIDSYATTVVGKNNSLNAPNINVAADTEVDELGIIYGAGMAGKVGVSGMVNMMYGDSFAIASIDDQTTINAPTALNVTSNNESDLIAVTGGVTLGESNTAAAVGAGFNLNNFDVHSFALIADNSSDQNVDDSVLTASQITAITNAVDDDIAAGKIDSDYRQQAIDEALSVARKTILANDHAKDVEAKRIDAVKAIRKVLSNDQVNLLGTKSDGRGSINAGNITLDATTDGTINSVAIEGSFIGDTNSAFNSVNKVLNAGDDFTNMGNSMIDFPGKKISSTLGGSTSSLLGRGSGGVGKIVNPGNTGLGGGRSGGFDGTNNGGGLDSDLNNADNGTNEVENPDYDDSDDPEATNEENLFGTVAQSFSTVSFQIAGAGSVAVNLSDGDTVALLDNANVNVNNLNLHSSDDLYSGAYSGGAAINWSNASSSNASGTVGAAAAVNQGDRKVDALLANSIVSSNGGDLDINASKNGVDVAAALGLAVAISSNTQANTINVSAGVGVNNADNDVRAMVVNSDTANAKSKFNNLDVHAQSNDVQVAGGAAVNLAIANSGSSVAVTANVMMSDIDNDLQAGIYGGQHFADNVDISTLKSDTQVNAAVSFSLSSSGDSTYGNTSSYVNPYSFGGTITLDNYDSSSNAFIDNTTINSNSINLLNDQKANDNSKRQTLENQGLDLSAAGYLGEQAQQYFKPNDAGGAVIVGAALGIQAAATFDSKGSSRPVGAAVAVNHVNVDDSVNINNATINSNSVVTGSLDKLSLVNVSAGVAASYSGGSEGSGSGTAKSSGVELIASDSAYMSVMAGLNIIGSVGWNVGNINNDVNINNSTINASKLILKSDNLSNVVNVAGEVSVGDAASLGLALASNSLNSSVDSSIDNATFNGLDKSTNSINVAANNNSHVVEVSACVNVSTSSKVLNANIAINKGFNDTVADIDRLNATNIDSLAVTADDTATKTTVAGTVNVAAGASLGAAVAYSAIGNDDDRESLQATINNSNIQTRQGADISLKTVDDSTISNTAAGVAIVFSGKDSFKFNANGAGAASYIYKDVDAGINNSLITGAPNLDIQANSDGKATSVAAIVSGSFKAQITAAVGVAINKIDQDTDAFFKNDSINQSPNQLANVDIRAKSNQDIKTGVASGALAISSDSIFTAAGSGSHNQIDSDTNALVQNVNANANKNFGVVSQSDDLLANYAGTVELSGGKVGIGVSASNNKINGDTTAKITGSTLSVAGSDDHLITVNHSINDGALISKAVDDNTWSAGGLADNRKSENLSGIVVDASSTHGLSSDLASVAVQFGDTGASLAGSLNFVNIGGNTVAAFDNSSNSAVNDKVSPNINIGAYDYTNKGGFIGGAAGAANFAAGVSVGVTDVERNVTASVNNDSNDPLNIDAGHFNVTSVSQQGISDFMLNAAVAFDDTFALETADNAAANSNTSTTTTKLNNVNVNFKGDSNINAEHLLNAATLNVAAGVSIATNPESGVAGALNTGISVTQDQSTVNNQISNSNLVGSAGSNANISSSNNAYFSPDMFSIGGAVAVISAGIAGDIIVNDLQTTTTNLIDNSTVSANTINVNTEDNIGFDIRGGSGAFGSLAGVGAAVNVNSINNTTNANITGSNLTASDALTVDTKEVRNFKTTLVAAGLGAVGLGVNIMVTNVNSNIGDIDSAYTRKMLNDNFDKVNEDRFDPDDVHGMSSADKAALQASLDAKKVNTDKVTSEGVITNVAGSTLTAGGALKIASTEQNDTDITNGSGSLGAAGVAVGDNILYINHKTNTILNTSDITGKSVDIDSTQTQADEGIKTGVYEVGVGLLEVGVGYNSVQLKGDTVVDVKGSNITATNGALNINALDNAKTDVRNFGVNAGVIGVPVTMAKSVNESATTVMIENSSSSGGINSDLSATGNLNVKARSANEAYVDATSASGGALVVATTTSTVRDDNKASVIVNDGNNRFGGYSINLTAESDPRLRTYAPSASVQAVGFTYVQSEIELKGGADVSVSSDNRFDSGTVNYKATTGSSNANRKAAYAEMYSVNGGGISIDTAPNTARITTDTTTNVKVGSQTYNGNTAVTVDSTSQLKRDAYANGYTIGIVMASGRDRAYVDAKDTVTAEIGSGNVIENNVSGLTVNATNTNLTDLKATGGSGGILDIASQSMTENASNIDVTAKVGGTWNVTGAVSINATSDDTVRGYARQGHGGAAGGAGVYADNDIKGTTSATVAENASINASTIEVNALNKFKTDGYKGEESFLLADYYGGGIEIDSLETNVDVNKKAHTDVGANASITTTGTQTYTATSNGDVMNKLNAAGGGLADALDADANTDVTTDNQVRFAAGSKARATGDSTFTVKAYDLLNVDSSAAGTNGGVAGFLFPSTTNDINRTNYIDVKGALSTAGNFDVEAGGTKDAFFDDGVRQVYVKTVTEANNYTLIDVSEPMANYSLTESNSINIDGSIDSGRDVNMRADGGKVEVLYSSRNARFANLKLYAGEGVPDLSGDGDSVEQGTYATNLLGTTVGEEDKSDKEKDGERTNYITVNGSINAGSAVRDVAINISGAVVPDKYYIVKNNASTRSSGKLNVTSDIDLDYTESSFDYADELSKRRSALIKLIDQYTRGEHADEVNMSAVSGFQMEVERIEDKMRELNLTVNEGNNKSRTASGIDVRCIELGNISLAGGNINLNTAAVKGSGTLTAKGAPNLNITNTSNAYLRIKGIELGGESGNVIVKGHAIAYAGEKGVSSSLKLDTAMLSGAGNITIYNNPDIGTLRIGSTTEPDNRKLDADYTPHPDLRIMGSVDNVNGDVSIINTRGDIDIAAPIEYDADGNVITTAQSSTANISGRNIYIEANGTINQGYIEGMVNVGGTPEYVLRADATSAVNKAHDELNLTASSDSRSYTVKKNVGNSGGDTSARNDNGVNGRIAGNNIYLAALDININGLIQAGYDTYTATVNTADLETLKTELANADTDALDKRMKDSSGRYAVNDAGAVYNSTQGYSDYELPVYYDADTNRLIMEPVVTGGGKVYLSGRIASTGNGRIYAANGYASIAINNNTDLPLETSRIINNERSGKITIVDTAKDTRTEYTPGQTLVIKNYTNLLKTYGVDDMQTIYSVAKTTSNNIGYLDSDTGVPATTVYEPAEGMRYYWVQGEKTMTDKIYHHTEEGWGILGSEFFTGTLLFGDSKETVERWEKDLTPRNSPGGRSALDKGGYLMTPDDLDAGLDGIDALLANWNNDNMNLKAESTLQDTTGPIGIAQETKVKSYVVANKYTTTTDWKYIYGSMQTYTFDINASKPITVGFFGRRTGPVSLNSGGSIYLNGDIEMSDGNAPLSIDSRHGGVYQSGAALLKTGNAAIHALDAISGINIETMGRLDSSTNEYYDELPLDIYSSGGGAIDINVVGGTTAGYAMPGDIFFDGKGVRSVASDGTRGNVTITTSGQMRGVNGVTGKTIVLTSANAGVGSDKDKPMRIDASNAVEVKANGDIFLSSPYDGTLRVGAISTENGNVHLSKAGMYGKVEPSATYQSGVERADMEELIKQWVDQGVIAPTPEYAGTYLSGLKARADEYAEQITAEYKTYATGKDAYQDLKTRTEQDFADYQALQGEYDSIEEGYYAYVDEVDEDFSEYLTATNEIRNSLESEYKELLKLQSKKTLTLKSEKRRRDELQAKYAGYDGWESYYLVNAKALIADLNEPTYMQYVGYDDIWDYILTTRPGQLMDKFTKSYDAEEEVYYYYESAEEYLATTSGYALDQKYGAYDSAASYLATDARYAELMDAYNNPKYPSTLEQKKLEQEIEQAAEDYNVTANHFYLNNVRIK